jgi:hypothetical protein
MSDTPELEIMIISDVELNKEKRSLLQSILDSHMDDYEKAGFKIRVPVISLALIGGQITVALSVLSCV